MKSLSETMADIEKQGGYSSNCTLRDYFAGQALTSLPNRSWDHIAEGDALIKAWAKAAYLVADEMLKARVPKS